MSTFTGAFTTISSVQCQGFLVLNFKGTLVLNVTGAFVVVGLHFKGALVVVDVVGAFFVVDIVIVVS